MKSFDFALHTVRSPPICYSLVWSPLVSSGLLLARHNPGPVPTSHLITIVLLPLIHTIARPSLLPLPTNSSVTDSPLITATPTIWSATALPTTHRHGCRRLVASCPGGQTRC